MTNVVALLGGLGAGLSAINWTAILAIITICLTAMATLIKIFGSKKSISDEDLRQSSYLKELESKEKEGISKAEVLKEYIATLRTDIEKLKVEQVNNSKSLDEVRKDNRELVQRLDDLLKQLVEWMD